MENIVHYLPTNSREKYDTTIDKKAHIGGVSEGVKWNISLAYEQIHLNSK